MVVVVVLVLVISTGSSSGSGSGRASGSGSCSNTFSADKYTVNHGSGGLRGVLQAAW